MRGLRWLYALGSLAPPPVVAALLLPALPAFVALVTDGVVAFLLVGAVGMLWSVMFSALWFGLIAPFVLLVAGARPTNARVWCLAIVFTSLLAVPFGVLFQLATQHGNTSELLLSGVFSSLVMGAYCGSIAGGAMVLRVQG
jgi:hypothetical protein